MFKDFNNGQLDQLFIETILSKIIKGILEFYFYFFKKRRRGYPASHALRPRMIASFGWLHRFLALRQRVRLSPELT